MMANRRDAYDRAPQGASVGRALHRLALTVPEAGWFIGRGRAFCCPAFLRAKNRLCSALPGRKAAPAGRFVCAGPSPYLYTATTVDPPPRFMEGTACGENGFGSFFQLYLPQQMNQEGL